MKTAKMKLTLSIIAIMLILILGYFLLAEILQANPNEPENVPSNYSDTDTAALILSNMTREEKVGQILFARCPQQDAASSVGQYHLGGYLLFQRDTEGKTAQEIQAEIQSYQNAAKIPMLIGVDEEGGSVTRVSRNPLLCSEPFASPQELYQEGGMDLIKRDAITKSQLLLSLGINVNFAPVADVSINAKDFMYERTFGKPAKETAEYVAVVTAAMQEGGVSAVLKHFPGYGNTMDTHEGSATDNRSLAELRSRDFLPFSAGIEADAYSVMVSHAIVSSIDPTLPASLSPAVHRILREELQFKGVIITDDLSMKAITLHSSEPMQAVAALNAGNDMLIISDIDAVYQALVAAVISGEIQESTLDQAVANVLLWKLKLDLL